MSNCNTAIISVCSFAILKPKKLHASEKSRLADMVAFTCCNCSKGFKKSKVHWWNHQRDCVAKEGTSILLELQNIPPEGDAFQLEAKKNQILSRVEQFCARNKRFPQDDQHSEHSTHVVTTIHNHPPEEKGKLASLVAWVRSLFGI